MIVFGVIGAIKVSKRKEIEEAEMKKLEQLKMDTVMAADIDAPEEESVKQSAKKPKTRAIVPHTKVGADLNVSQNSADESQAAHRKKKRLAKVGNATFEDGF